MRAAAAAAAVAAAAAAEAGRRRSGSCARSGSESPGRGGGFGGASLGVALHTDLRTSTVKRRGDVIGTRDEGAAPAHLLPAVLVWT